MVYKLLQTARVLNYTAILDVYSIDMAVCDVFYALLVVTLLQLCNCGNDGSYYTTRFMVEVGGGHKMADKVAHAHGMKNLGEVSLLAKTKHGYLYVMIVAIGWWA